MAGSMDMTNITIPIPPSQWDMAFHRRMLLVITPESTAVQPVVVNPDVASKKASIYVSANPER